MAYSVTLENLRAACLEQADEQGYGYIDNTQLDRLISRSWARFYGRWAQVSEDHFTTTDTITTAAGTESYSLPADFLMLRYLEADLGGVRPARLRKFSLQERHLLGGSWTPGQMIAYRIVGEDSVRFLPVPSAVHTVTVFYVPAPSVLAEAEDTIDVRAGWDDWIVYDVVAKIALKQERDVSVPIALRDSVWREDILPLVAEEDTADPECVRDVEGDIYYDDGSW